MKKIKLTILVVLCLVLIMLVVQNTASVEAHFLGFTAEMSLVILLFLTGTVGFISGLLLGFLLKSGRSQNSVKQTHQ